MNVTDNMIISGFVSKVIKNCSDIVINKIESANENRKSHEQNIETRIYQVTIEAVEVVARDYYISRGDLYEAAESILRGFKRRRNIKQGRFKRRRFVGSGFERSGYK